MKKILVIDSQKSVRNSLKELLEHEGFLVECAENVVDAPIISTKPMPDLVICGDPQGFARGSLCMPWIALSDSPTIENAVRLIRQGAVDFISKPVDINRLLEVVRNTLEETDAPPEPSVVRTTATMKKPYHKERIIGSSPKIQAVRNLIDKVAPSEARVLISGANGTGKELVARWLHEKSPRQGAPFVEVNCAAIPSELIESELFGHEKGAFTSAIKQRKGKFEQAIGGTLFLDEIGDMSLSAQAKVLRALQESKISRVGSDRDISVDVRVVAATNKNLREEIDKGNFREDLYHRLSVIVIRIPSISERKEDVPLLIDYFLDKICGEYGLAIKKIESSAIAALSGMAWTGNIREIRNVMERLIILSGDVITLADVQAYALGV